jgi:hypothetical protein
MSRKPEFDRGFREGYRWAIWWLHKRAREMNDPHAKTILNTAAFHMGVEGKELRPVASKEPVDVRELAAAMESRAVDP